MPLLCPARRTRDTQLAVALTASMMCGVATASTLRAQQISPRTVPVQMGQQFDIVPSDRAAMGNVRIAVDDALLDPFVNPAKATRLRNGVLSVAPVLLNQSNDRGGAKTLPISGIFTTGAWSFGGIFALQQLDRTRLLWNAPTSERTASNQYLSAIVARQFGDGYSLGASVYSATLEAEQGIDQLYSGADRITQDGSASDARIGLTRRWKDGQKFEALLLRSNFDMAHDVHYPAFVQYSGAGGITRFSERSESYRDHTTTWGAHSEYSRPIGSDGWTLGVLGTVNRLSHPTIPDYRINNVFTVPHDPGQTWAYNAGLGMSRVLSNAVFGFDVVLEPMYSTTWAEAMRDTVSATGAAIMKGAHTVDNRFRFSNSELRFGAEHMKQANDSSTHFGLQYGLSLYSIRYRLAQTDLISTNSRVQREHWMEWTPSIGFKVRSPGFEVRYSLSFTCGGGGECIPCPMCGEDVALTTPNAGGVIAAPTAALQYNGGRVTTQRLSVSLRIR